MVSRAIKTTALGAALLALGMAACDASDEVAPPPPEDNTGLSPQALFVRASLDIRGIRPSGEELDALEQTPDQLDVMLDELVDDPRFGDRVRSIFAPAVRTRRDRFRFGVYDLDMPEEDELRLQRAFAEESLNIMHYVAVSDRPFSEILTADYTIVDPILVPIWPLEVSAEQPEELPAGTQLAKYTDGRPAAGVLATNSFFWRHTSTVENANRGRTNAVSRAFLCEDYLERPIDFPRDVDLTDSEGIREAIRTNSGCQACHATLDPFASHLWGFMQLSEDVQSWATYNPENEVLWKQETEAQPSFFGKPTSGTLRGLGQAIAGDERFVGCAVRRMYEAFLGRPAALADEGQLAFHRESFLSSGLSLKALVRSLLTDPAYRGKEAVSDFGGTPAAVDLKLISPEQMSTSLTEISGYSMTLYGRRLTDLDVGLRALAGGSERGASATPSLGGALVLRRLAEASARALVANSTPGSRLDEVLGDTPLSARPEAALVAALIYETQSAKLSSDSDQVTELLALWDSVAADEDPDAAWTAMLTAILSDPLMAVY